MAEDAAKDRAPSLSTMSRFASELFALALLVGRQGGSLGLRSTLAPWRWGRERHRLGRGLYDLGVAASVPRGKHDLDNLDPLSSSSSLMLLTPPVCSTRISLGTKSTSSFKKTAGCCFITLSIAARPPRRKAACISRMVSALRA